MPIDPFTALNAMLRAEAARNSLATADALRDAANNTNAANGVDPADARGKKPRSERSEQADSVSAVASIRRRGHVRG